METESKPQVLPAWKSCLEAMREQGIEHEKVFTVEWLAKTLRFDADSMAFGIAISDIRRELEQDGFYLNGYGQNHGAVSTAGDGFISPRRDPRKYDGCFGVDR